jgi:glycosyltransferase involved in cell wall biosynthesis
MDALFLRAADELSAPYSNAPTSWSATKEEASSCAPKVIFVNRFFYPDESASSQILTDLALHLSDQGVQVSVVASRSAHGMSGSFLPRERLKTIDIVRVRSAGGWSKSTAGKLLQYLSFYPGAFITLMRVVKKGDVVVAKTDPPLISVLAALVARVKGAKLMNWLQDIYPEVATALGTPGAELLESPLLRLRDLALGQATTNVVIGAKMADRVFARGIPKNKIRVIPNWADEHAIQPTAAGSSRTREALGLNSSDIVIGYSGNLGQAHETDTLVGAAEILRDRADLKFLFTGGGRQHGRLQSLIEARDLKNFIFLPHQPRDQLSDTLAAADVHWLSLRPELEGLIVPSKLYGILAAGRPVLAVCDWQGEVSKLVEKHQCGFVIQPGDAPALAQAIAKLADDPILRHGMACRSRQASEQNYSKNQSLTSWSHLIRSLLARDMFEVTSSYRTRALHKQLT